MMVLQHTLQNHRDKEHIRTGGMHLLQQVIAEIGHQLGAAAAGDLLVAERLKGLLERLVEQRGAAEALRHVLRRADTHS